MNPKAHNALFTTLGAVVGLLVGSLTVFTFLEKRITDAATDKTSVAMRMQSLEIKLAELKSDFWMDKSKTENAIDKLQSSTSVTSERLLKIELSKP